MLRHPCDVIIKTRFVGFHRWSEANEDVGYLRHTHRHEFVMRVEARSILGDGRNVEFHTLKRATRDVLSSLFGPIGVTCELILGDRSCETVAQQVGIALRERGWPIMAVECWEDDENGARVTTF